MLRCIRVSHALSCCRLSSSSHLYSRLISVSEKDTNLSESHTVVCKNGVIACWHPETPFPYEDSLPISAEDLKKDRENLLTSHVLSEEIQSKQRRKVREPSLYDLQNLFYTTKHEWFGRYCEKRLHQVAAPDPEKQL
ncbi:hypothetical protein AB6A40_008858 [Gnathostoma spinigerum]|uniref:Large ribosomal subunit protein mL42 n=1 Tax=Gnathostoma spinigerum TaxID=75299 RepID=A0ABD6EVD1_9BILA